MDEMRMLRDLGLDMGKPIPLARPPRDLDERTVRRRLNRAATQRRAKMSRRGNRGR